MQRNVLHARLYNMQNIRCATCFCMQEHTIAQWLCKIAGATLHTYAPEDNAPVPGMQLSSDTVIQLSKFNPSFQSGMHLCTCNETFPGCNAACSGEENMKIMSDPCNPLAGNIGIALGGRVQTYRKRAG